MTVPVGRLVRQDPLVLPAGATLLEAAKAMQERQADDALVMDYGTLRGIVTRRDVTVRADAEGRDPSCTSLAEVCRR
ncbi:MAG: CBS domain-containing protein, partial [Candidatus Dormibacteraeota bacterium]|nr:CBS domain-containing protein [Candidatus Dormibacteraeota bacterium]